MKRGTAFCIEPRCEEELADYARLHRMLEDKGIVSMVLKKYGVDLRMLCGKHIKEFLRSKLSEEKIRAEDLKIESKSEVTMHFTYSKREVLKILGITQDDLEELVNANFLIVEGVPHSQTMQASPKQISDFVIKLGTLPNPPKNLSPLLARKIWDKRLQYLKLV